MVKTSIISEFIRLLKTAEDKSDPTGLVKLFAENAELHNLTRPTAFGDEEHFRTSSAPHFWSQYISAFEYVTTQFTEISDFENRAVLEWHSTGCLRMSLPIDYRGVTIIEHDGERITALRTYYDSAAFLPNASLMAKTHSETAGIPRITNEATS